MNIHLLHSAPIANIQTAGLAVESKSANGLSVSSQEQVRETVNIFSLSDESSAKTTSRVDDDKSIYEDPRLPIKERQLAQIESKREQAMMAEIKQLSMRDREVRAHEQAHMAVGGQYAGSASYEFQRGPNGVRYAVGGEVPISTGAEATPEETLKKAQIIRAAALAPAEPSPQDRKVAAMATQMEAKARSDIAQTKKEETTSEVEAEAEDKAVGPKQVSEDSEVSEQVYDEFQGKVNEQRRTNIRELFSFVAHSSGQLLSEHA